MNNINTAFAAKIYAAPAISVTEVEIEGVLCDSSVDGAFNENYVSGGSWDF